MTTAATTPGSQLLPIVRSVLSDLRQQGNESRPLSLDSTLDHDLGLDSLARVELFARIEHELNVRLPDALFGSAETLRDIACALERSPSPPRAARTHVDLPAAPSRAPSRPPPTVTTLDEVLRWHRDHQPDFVQITILGDAHDETVTYERLWLDARSIAGGLQRYGIRRGDTVSLMLPTSRDYFTAFFGVLLAGAVPVPLYPPARMSQIEEHVRRHAGILANAAAAILITTSEMRRLGALLRMHAPSLRKLTTAAELRSLCADPVRVVLNAESIALLQYTSGSTGQPKGVVLTHANVLSNISALGTALGVTCGDVFVSWLPLYHDMGLIGAWLGTFYFGLPLIVMPPLSFLTRPIRWLEAIDRCGGTLSAAPNFAYELCLKRVSDAELRRLDLRTWRLAMNGAEAVIPETLTRFQERFSRCGLRATTLTPVYGLAECSVGLTIPPLDRGPWIDAIDRESFTRDGLARPVGAASAHALRFVSCGRPLAGHQVRIVDAAGKPLPERREGRLELRGPSATRGYFRNADATGKLIHDGWLDSGDRAYRANGEIFVTGRIKDIIIRAGRHIYPDELEAAIGAVDGIRKGCVAVFGSTDASTGTERLVVLAETRSEQPSDRDPLRQSIIATVMELLGEPPDEVVLAAPHTVLKTSSGKIRRTATREAYERGAHRVAQQHGTRMQLVRLFVSGLRPGAWRVARRASELLYGTYFWSIVALVGGGAMLVVLLPLRANVLWSSCHHAARSILRLTNIPLVVAGHEPRRQAPRIVVANHASYLDGLFLLAAFAHPARFVAKRELAHVPIVGLFLRRIGTVFVDRFDVRASIKDARHLSDLAGHGASFIFFPEGTFTRAPGLMAFHLGAFAAAAHAGMPVVPVALRGTRALLRDEEWLPKRAPVVVHICRPLTTAPAERELAAAAWLRDAARQQILQHCGEPDLLGAAACDGAGSLGTEPLAQ